MSGGRRVGWIIKSTLQLQEGFDLPQEALFLLNLPLHVLTPSTMQMLGAVPVVAHADCQPGLRSFNSEEMVINARARLRLCSSLMPGRGKETRAEYGGGEGDDENKKRDRQGEINRKRQGKSHAGNGDGRNLVTTYW